MRRTSYVGRDIGSATPGKNKKLRGDWGKIVDLKSGVDVDLENLPSYRRENKGLLLIGNVSSAPLKQPLLER